MGDCHHLPPFMYHLFQAAAASGDGQGAADSTGGGACSTAAGMFEKT